MDKSSAAKDCWCEIVNGKRHLANGCPKHDPVGSAATVPLVVTEALLLADRIEKGYPEHWLREESQDALVQLARFVREELKLDV